MVQTKCGIRFEDDPKGAPARYDYSKEHILRTVEGSLKRLGTDYVDFLLLHRRTRWWSPRRWPPRSTVWRRTERCDSSA